MHSADLAGQDRPYTFYSNSGHSTPFHSITYRRGRATPAARLGQGLRGLEIDRKLYLVGACTSPITINRQLPSAL